MAKLHEGGLLIGDIDRMTGKRRRTIWQALTATGLKAEL